MRKRKEIKQCDRSVLDSFHYILVQGSTNVTDLE